MTQSVQTTPTVTLAANPTSVTSGGSSTLTWSSTNSTSCTASGGWSGSKATSGSQTLTNLTTTATYTLTCTGAGGSAARSATITVTSSGPLIVGPTSHVIVMEYEAWYNPLFNSNVQLFANYQPLLTSKNVSIGYDSTDPAIIDQHLKWFSDLGVDAITAEQSDGGPCDYGDAAMCAQFLGSSTNVAPFTAVIHAINNGSFNDYTAFEQRGAPIKIIPVLDGRDALMFTARGDGQTPFDVQVGAFYKYMTQYPDMNVIYQGKPLLTVVHSQILSTTKRMRLYKNGRTASRYDS